MEVAVKQALVECTALFTVFIATDQPPCADHTPNTLILADRPRSYILAILWIGTQQILHASPFWLAM